MGLKFNDPSSKIWVLVDSSPTLPEPTPVFLPGYPFFVIEAASRRLRFEWAKKVHSAYFCMKTWSFSEVLQVYVTSPSGVHSAHYFCSHPFLAYMTNPLNPHGGPPDKSQLRYLYNEYRVSPRQLTLYAWNPEEFKDLVIAQVQLIRPDNLRYVLQAPDSDESSHLITRIEPSATSRSLPKKTIASSGAFKLLWHQHLANRLSDTAYFYDIFEQGGQVTASAAGWIFEFRMHQLLTQGYRLNIYPLCQKNEGPKNDIYRDYTSSYGDPTTIQLAASSEYPLNRGIHLDPNLYYRPNASNFPMIDSLFLIPHRKKSPILLMFQITWNKGGHHVKGAGLERINELMLPSHTHKYLVVVTPLGMEPPILAPKGSLKDVYVFHHPVSSDMLFPPGAV
jgi:hypothetical protein